ncbi:MAG: TerC family protein [Coriobacteriaceae bacterium]|nr:TerC family protein [Coriobacteriaceae bacterium]
MIGFIILGRSRREGRIAVDLSVFTTPEAWVSLVTLIFLEIVLGVDNLVFIAITTDRLPPEKQQLGRRLGLAGALVMRVLFLCFASYLIHISQPLFTLGFASYSHGFSVRDIVLLAGGAYLIYKGVVETRHVLSLVEVKAQRSEKHRALHLLGLPQAVGTIMVMDIVFSIDSVITAVGLAQHLIVMIIAVMVAVLVMMVFIDPISDFINHHVEMKILALCFVVVIGILLVLDSMGLHSGIEVMDMAAEKLMVYFAMLFALVIELIQMGYHTNYTKWVCRADLQPAADDAQEPDAAVAGEAPAPDGGRTGA